MSRTGERWPAATQAQKNASELPSASSKVEKLTSADRLLGTALICRDGNNRGSRGARGVAKGRLAGAILLAVRCNRGERPHSLLQDGMQPCLRSSNSPFLRCTVIMSGAATKGLGIGSSHRTFGPDRGKFSRWLSHRSTPFPAKLPLLPWHVPESPGRDIERTPLV